MIDSSFRALKDTIERSEKLKRDDPVEYWLDQVELVQGGANGPTIKLRAAIETLRQDAQRYRWLRDVAQAADWEHYGHTTTPETTDAAIDAAIAKEAT